MTIPGSYIPQIGMVYKLRPEKISLLKNFAIWKQTAMENSFYVYLGLQQRTQRVMFNLNTGIKVTYSTFNIVEDYFFRYF